MENTSNPNESQQTSGKIQIYDSQKSKMKKNNRLNEVKNNDLYELLYGLK